MFALVKLVFGCLQPFLNFRMFDISDVCPSKAVFWFSHVCSTFVFSDVDISVVRPGKAGFRIFASLFRFSDVRHI